MRTSRVSSYATVVTELLVEFFVLPLLFFGDGSALVFRNIGPWDFRSPSLLALPSVRLMPAEGFSLCPTSRWALGVVPGRFRSDPEPFCGLCINLSGDWQIRGFLKRANTGSGP